MDCPDSTLVPLGGRRRQVCEGRRHYRPQQLQERPSGRLDYSPVLLGFRRAEQMQLAARACGRDVQHSRGFTFQFALLNPRHVFVDRICVLARRGNWREQQPASLFQPDQQRRFVLPRRRGQTRKNHRVEFQTLGLVNGHDLQDIAGLRVGLGKQLVHLFSEPREVG